jgi:fibronectin type 3 domain-containing protein
MIPAAAPRHSSKTTSTTIRILGYLGAIIILFGAGSAKADTVNLGWNGSSDPGIQGYRVYVGTTQDQFTQTYDTGTGTTFAVNGLESGKVYYFAVSAIGSTGLESELSDEITVTLESAPPINPPETSLGSAPALSGTPGNMAITMTTAAAGTYVLERSTDLKNWEVVTQTQLSAPGQLEFQDTDAPATGPTPAKMFYRIGRQS